MEPNVRMVAVAALVVYLAGAVLAGPKKYDPETTAVESNALSQDGTETREGGARFGIQTNTISTTGSAGLFPGLNPGPIKLDLGGLLLGAVLGLGAVLVLPKLFHAVSPLGYDGYKRSEDGGAGGGMAEAAAGAASGLADALSRLDTALARHHVDSSACVQRAVCAAVRNARSKVQAGGAGYFDAAVDAVANTELLGMMLEGTAVKTAVEAGRGGEDCSATFAGCVATRDALLAAVRGLAATSDN